MKATQTDTLAKQMKQLTIQKRTTTCFIAHSKGPCERCDDFRWISKAYLCFVCTFKK